MLCRKMQCEKNKIKTLRSDNSLAMLLEHHPDQEVILERSSKPVMTHSNVFNLLTGNVFFISTDNSVFYLRKRSNIHKYINYCYEYINR